MNKTVGSVITEQGTKGKVVTVLENARTSEAFKVLLDSEVSSVAVVNAAGKLVGNLSSSDLKGTMPGHLFEQFYFPVSKFIGEAARRFGRDTTWPICCTEEETLEMALEKLTTKHIHRVYVIDKEKKPIGVLSLCDFITQLQYGENL
jgi:5'-AMP-activated protein kinase, regulatory gamma subunit